MHAAVPCGIAGQTFPHDPQLLTLVAVEVSHPFDALLSQLPQPDAQMMPHTPVAHVGVPFVALQMLPHAPQLVTPVPVSVSHPLPTVASQSAQPVSHEPMPHTPPAHVSTACAKLHDVEHELQWRGSVCRFASHPFDTALSQLPQPDVHAMLQTPPVHAAVPLMLLHVLPHEPQFARFELVLVSQPFDAL